MTTRDWFDPRDEDALVRWLESDIVRHAAAIGDEDDRFLDWLTRDLRRRAAAATDWSGDRVRRVRQRVLDRALAGRYGVEPTDGAPPVHEVESRRVRDAVDAAARAHGAPWMSLAASAGVGRDLWDEECDRWIQLPDRLDPGRFVALQVAGDSMLPLLHSGDTILVRVGDAVASDTIVVARHGDDGYVVKRVGRMTRRALELLSLNESYAPLRVRRDPGAVVGTVIMRWCPHDGAIVPARRDS
jgi:SOS-response transcriptional repressor LexA